MSREVPKDVIGVRLAGETADPLDHFYVCRACAQPVDKRDLGAVFHHEEADHEPLAMDEAMRLLALEDRFRLTLMQGTPRPTTN